MRDPSMTDLSVTDPSMADSSMPDSSRTSHEAIEQSGEAGQSPTVADEKATQGLSWSQTIRSGLLAGLGVQSSSNRERDFQQGSLMRFVAVGVGLTAAFVLSLLFLVKALVN